MPRFRVLLALLLAATWCSAAWHVELEAIGWVLNHEHRAHGGHEHPAAVDEHHEPVFARNLTKDGQFRIGANDVLTFAFIFGISGLSTASYPLIARTAVTFGASPSDPPWAQVWQFVWRCAPDSAAPPVLS